MSANDWEVCPKCHGRGKTQPSAILALLEHLEEASGELPPQTLREDYEFYLQGEILHISYGARCDECGFRYVFSQKVNIVTGAALE